MSHTIFIISYEYYILTNEDLNKWQNLNVFILGWTKKSNCGQVTKLCRMLKEYKNYFNMVSDQDGGIGRHALPPTQPQKGITTKCQNK